jgi:hypothetical protein
MVNVDWTMVLQRVWFGSGARRSAKREQPTKSFRLRREFQRRGTPLRASTDGSSKNLLRQIFLLCIDVALASPANVAA